MNTKTIEHHGCEITVYPLDWKPGYYGSHIKYKDGGTGGVQSYCYAKDALNEAKTIVEQKMRVPVIHRPSKAHFVYNMIIFGPIIGLLLCMVALFVLAIIKIVMAAS